MRDHISRRIDKKREFDQILVDVARVARIVAGGRRFKFRASVVIGNRKGKVGFAVAKGPDVTVAMSKASKEARKNLITIPIVNGTIPHEIKAKFSAAKIFLKPARRGTGIIAGGAMRAVAELGGIKDIIGKSLGSENKINNVRATLKALSLLETPEYIASIRGVNVARFKKEDIKDKKNAVKGSKIEKEKAKEN